MSLVVFGGTYEGRLIAECFNNTDVEVNICVTTEYGASLLPEGDNIKIHSGAMDCEEIEKFLNKVLPEYCIDATHPYAVQATENICNACKNTGTEYIRVLREENADLKSSDVIYMESIERAAEFLNSTEGNILITTGSKELEKYIAIRNYKERCTARVLSTEDVIKKCSQLGFEGKNLICMQGPFSEEMNYCMLKDINAEWLVTKSSGNNGGFNEKCNAAVRAGAKIIVIGRGQEKYENSTGLYEAIDFLKEKYNISTGRRVSLVGIGMGRTELMTGEALSAVEKSDVIIGAKRIVRACRKCCEKPFYESYKKGEIVDFLNKHTEYRNAAIVYSGDIGFYSAAKGMREMLKDYDVSCVSGIATPVYFLNRLGIPWDSVRLLSCHGQNVNIISAVSENERVCVLLGGKNDAAEISRKLIKYGMDNVKITVGERLSYDNEKITVGYPAEFENTEFDTLAAALFENNDFCKRTGSIRDDEFVRGNVPMTKEEVRTVALSKLHIGKDSIVYDVGAGTGSVSVEAALMCDEGFVYAIEKKSDAVRLIEENKIKFKADNIKITEGEAPLCLKELPAPTHAFIGGSSGKIKDIIEAIRNKNINTRFVVNAVSVETIAEMEGLKDEYNMEIVQIGVSRARKVGEYRLMTAENPVFIFAFGGE